MKPEELKQLELMDHPVVQKLLTEYRGMIESPVFPAWKAMKIQIDIFTKEMSTEPIGIRSKKPKKKQGKKEDDAPEDPVTDEKDFAKAEKVMDKMVDWVKKLQLLYGMMNAAEKQKADLSKNTSEQVYI